MKANAIQLTILAAFAGACSSSPSQPKPEQVNETRTISRTNAVTARPASSKDAGEWNEARGGLLRTFAFRALDRDLLEEGRQYLAQACEADPNDSTSHAALARLYLAEGDAQSALVYASRASAAAPTDPEVNLVYAAALAETNQPSKATEQLEQSWASVSSDPEFARSILMHYATMGDSERAQDFVTKELTENPELAGSWAAAGDLMLAEGDMEGAAASYQHALKIDPTVYTPPSMDDYVGRVSRNEDPILASARAAEVAGNWQEAVNLYQFMVGKESVPPAAHLGLARCFSQLNRPQEAELQLSQVDPGVRGWRGHLLQARLDIAASRWSNARTSCLLALEERPGLRSAELLLQFVTEKEEAAKVK